MEKQLPQHIAELLQKRRDEFIYQMYKEDFKLGEIGYIFKLSPQRVWQIILKSNQKGQ